MQYETAGVGREYAHKAVLQVVPTGGFAISWRPCRSNLRPGGVRCI